MKLSDYHPIRKYVKKTEKRIALKIKTGYYLELLISERMRLFGSTKNKANKDNWGKCASLLNYY